MWQNDCYSYLSSDPELLAALQDPRRVFNQDETAIELGMADQVKEEMTNSNNPLLI